MSDAELTATLARLTADFPGVAGIAARRLDPDVEVGVSSDELFPTASAIKVFVLFELLRRASDGGLDLGERVEVAGDDKTLGSGALLHLDAGLRPTLRDLGTLMMMLSDNTATNLLIRRLGVEAVNRAIRSAGLSRTRLAGSIDFARIAEDKTALGVATPRELCHFYARLGRGELLPASFGEQMLDVLRIQKYIEPLRRELPADPYAREFGEPEPAWVASKTGSFSGVRCEAGLVTTPGARWSIAVMTREGRDPRVTSDNAGVVLIARASRLVYDAWA